MDQPTTCYIMAPEKYCFFSLTVYTIVTFMCEEKAKGLVMLSGI